MGPAVGGRRKREEGERRKEEGRREEERHDSEIIRNQQ
jgi:hypothetical protein